jgi:threonine/homoserine/homoserine lactone efflux protein
MNWHLFSAFLAITAILVVTPGPIVTLLITTGATQGMRAALTTVIGTSLGNALLLAAIALGLNWVLAHALGLFEVLRWIGAAYLVWLGIQAWRSGGDGRVEPPSRRVNFSRGLIVAVSNPKTIVFFTAFLPQFIDPRLPSQPQLLAMCGATILLAALSDSGWAIASGLGRVYFLAPLRARLLKRLSGGVLIAGGLWLSLARRPS